MECTRTSMLEKPESRLVSLSLLILFFLSIIPQPSFSADPTEDRKLEEIINECMDGYPFTDDNRFRLSAYAELKGKFGEGSSILTLDFGSLGTMFFFENNCLLRNAENNVFYLNKDDDNPPLAKALNEGIEFIFEKINLLGNHKASMAQIDFIDAKLAKKNIEPFYKIYIRHILTKYGQYDSTKNQVLFHTDYISDVNKLDESVRKNSTPMKIVLEDSYIKGYYLDVGGEVYMYDEEREVFYVSGEDFNYNNVTAFKLFIQKLFAESIQYVAAEESKRIAGISRSSQVRDGVIAKAASSAYPMRKLTRKQKEDMENALNEMYGPYSWIPMMLNMLRDNRVNIGEPDIIKYFVDLEFFDRLYAQLNTSEKEMVDDYLVTHVSTGLNTDSED